MPCFLLLRLHSTLPSTHNKARNGNQAHCDIFCKTYINRACIFAVCFNTKPTKRTQNALPIPLLEGWCAFARANPRTIFNECAPEREKNVVNQGLNFDRKKVRFTSGKIKKWPKKVRKMLQKWNGASFSFSSHPKNQDFHRKSTFFRRTPFQKTTQRTVAIKII